MFVFWFVGYAFTVGLLFDEEKDNNIAGIIGAALCGILWPFMLGVTARKVYGMIEKHWGEK